MAKRLLPTGTCWCGCRTETDLGSFFAPGHDKKAESRVIMEVFGGVPQFLVAFGHGPGGDSAAATTSWIESATRLAGFPTSTIFVIEYRKPASRSGPLAREPKAKLACQVDLSEGSVAFNVESGGCTSSIVIPFIDVQGIYKEHDFWVVRVGGAIEGSGGQLGGVKYTPYG